MEGRVANLFIIVAILAIGKTLWVGPSAESWSMVSWLCIVYYGENILHKLTNRKDG